MSERYSRRSYSRPVNTEPPSVEVVIVHRRALDHAWLKQAVESVEGQSYPNTSLLLVDNQDMSVNMGAALNQAVETSEAELMLFLMEEDQLTWDTVQSMVDMFNLAHRFQPNVVHVTTFCTLILDGQPGVSQANIHAPGMWLRAHLQEHRFDDAMDANVHRAMASQLQDLQRLTGNALTTAFAHHYGYIMRQHTFRGDGYQLQFGR